MSKIQCLFCGQVVESKHRHDFQRCACPNGAFVDGGNEYVRCGSEDIMAIAHCKESQVLGFKVEWRQAYISIGDSDRELILMRGLPGSSKSTVAMAIRQEFGAKIFSTDEFFIDKDFGHYIFDASLLGKAHFWNQNRCKKAIDSRYERVIIDNTNLTAKEVRPYLDMAVNADYNIWCVEPIREGNDNLSVLFERNIHGVPMESLVRMKNRMQPTLEFCQKCREYINAYEITT